MSQQNNEITDNQIRQLRNEAAAAGDIEMVADCEAALDGDAEARESCQRAIDAAAAMNDGEGK